MSSARHLSRDELLEEIADEKRMAAAFQKSVQDWDGIVQNSATDVEDLTKKDQEWKIRYECQHLCNRKLHNQIRDMRMELRLLQRGQNVFSTDTAMDRMTLGECRTYIKNLEIEKCSISSLRQMYERHLDIEAMAYHRAREEIERIIHDVSMQQTTMIRDQENKDQNLMNTLRHTRKHNVRKKQIARIKPIQTQPPVANAPVQPTAVPRDPNRGYRDAPVQPTAIPRDPNRGYRDAPVQPIAIPRDPNRGYRDLYRLHRPRARPIEQVYQEPQEHAPSSTGPEQEENEVLDLSEEFRDTHRGYVEMHRRRSRHDHQTDERRVHWSSGQDIHLETKGSINVDAPFEDEDS